MAVRASQTAKGAGVSFLTRKSDRTGPKAAAPVAAPPPAAAPLPATSKQLAFELCTDALTQGCVTAFVEFFTLSHREPVCVDQLANKMFTVPDERMAEIQGTLTHAEKSRRTGEFREVYHAYVKLANYFEDERDFGTCLHFHQMGLDSAKQSSDKELEGVANENFGNAHERLGNIASAIQYHETHLRLAEAARNGTMKRQANKNLIRVYLARAAECEAAGDYPAAREYYEKSMNTARSNSDTTAEGEAYHKLGNITVLLGDLEKAVEYQKRFLLVAKEIRNDAHEGKAQISLADLQEELGQAPEAINSLQRALEIAEERGNKVAICEACTKLGLLHNKEGNFVKAVHYLEQNYSVAKQLGDKALIEKARILVAVAQGNNMWSTGFVKTVNLDVAAVVQWKCKGVMQ